ncbi:MAG: hypothetical protein ABI685_09340 [Ferruginibacter sp.]
MTDTLQPENTSWSLLKKISFRFFFIYFVLYTSPLNWVGVYQNFFEWLVIKANANFFQVFGIKNVKPVSNGSGDTSYAWAANYLMLVLAVGVALTWSLLERKRKSYRQLNYLLCLFIRYTLAFTAFGYGVNKIFALQMPFPMMSQLATPLGDLLPMRFSWLFIGYSAPYEVFSGVMEVLVALLLLYRRTATLGALIATAVFLNVMMLNLCYDIPVKLYSMNLVLMCLYLVVNELKRIACFFVLDKPTATCSVYHYPLVKKWMRITRIILKLAIIFFMGNTFYETMQFAKKANATAEHKDFKKGMYDVTRYVINKDTLPALVTDTLRWRDVIFENNQMGSVNTSDTMFRKRYGRGYFVFAVDSLQPIINFKKNMQDDSPRLSLSYQMIDSNTIQLWGKQRNDSLFIELKRSNRHFQLAEKQFHWLSEANR